MKVFIGSDHAGFGVKSILISYLSTLDFLDVHDCGADSDQQSDYPKFASEVAKNVLLNQGSFGILLCGSGVGVSIVANRFKGIRAALCHNVKIAEVSRMHNDANVLCLGSRVVSGDEAKEMALKFLTTNFESGRHAKRVEMIDNVCNSV